MPVTYSEWMTNYKASQGGMLLGKCREAVQRMSQAFPELTAQRGHVHCAWGKRAHWWLTTPDGEILDPTRDQFPGPVDYEEWETGEPVRVGKCMECGDEIWKVVDSLDNVRTATFCGETCHDAFSASLMGGRS